MTARAYGVPNGSAHIALGWASLGVWQRGERKRDRRFARRREVRGRESEARIAVVMADQGVDRAAALRILVGA